MARVKIEFPEKFIFSTEVKVRISDINYGGHVGNDTILSIIHESRLQFYQYFGYSELDLGGTGTIMADSAIVYKGESFYGDTLKIEVGVGNFHKYGFDLFYYITNASSGKAIAEAKTGIICFDYNARKITSLPEVVKNTLS
jgi:acyl-CoA thioester hydrolase